MSLSSSEESPKLLASNKRHEEGRASQPGQNFDPERTEESDGSSEHVPGRRSVRVTPYGLKQDGEIVRIWVDEKSTYGDVREALATLYNVQAITVLQAVYSPKPYWIASDSESTIEPTCLGLYAVIIAEPRRYSLSVVRTALLDYPIAIFDSKNGPAITISQAIIMARPNLTDRIRSIMGYTTNWKGDEDQYSYEHIRKLEHSTFPTVFFIMVDEPPGPFLANASDESIPPFLQIQFVQCRELLRRAYNLELIPLQAIHVSRALYHLIISLAKALEGVFNEEDTAELTERDNVGDVLRVAPITADNLQSILYSFGGTLKALEEKSVDPKRPMADIRRILDALCGDYPGAVVVRQSFETFERLVRMDREEIRLSISNEKDIGTAISGNAVKGGHGKPGNGAHVVSDIERITYNDEEASGSGQGYKGTSFLNDKAAAEPAKRLQTRYPLAELEDIEPDKELDAIVNRAFSSLQVVEPWREASTNHPQLQQVIKKLQSNTLEYCQAMDTSIKTAQDGLDFSCDAIELCGHLLDPDADPNDLQGYIGDMQSKAKLAHEDSLTTLNKFRAVRRGLMEITRTIPKEALSAPEKGAQGFVARLFSIGGKRDVEIDAAIKQLHLAALDIAELADNVDNFANWWNRMDSALTSAEINASYLKPGRNSMRVEATQRTWTTIRDDYKQYSRAFRAVLASSAPVTFVSSWIGGGIQHLQKSLR